jgi:hypothetical protein
MPSQRPGSVTAAAVMGIIYGSLLLLCSVCGVIRIAAHGAIGGNLFAGGDANQAQVQKEMENILQRDVPGYRAVEIVMPLLGLAEGIALLIGGIGLLGLHSWARTLTLVACSVAIVSTLFQTIYQAALVLPATGKAVRAAMPKAPQGPGGPEFAQLMETIFPLIAVVAVVFYILLMIYLLIMVMLLRRRHVSAAFAAAGEFSDEREERRRLDEDENADEDEDDGWDRSRRTS